MNFTVSDEGVLPVDCRYLYEGITSAFLIIENGQAGIVDTGTYSSVPYFLEALKGCSLSGKDVKYIIVTHVHLDHSGGTNALLEHCPNATVLCHPKAALHLADPSRLVKSAKMLYGEAHFQELYGEILPIDQSKIQIMEDEQELRFGDRALRFLHTKGHANHHVCIYDSKSKGVFTGDTFGVAYPVLQTGERPFLYPTTTPVDFDAGEARKSIRRISELTPSCAYLAHYGIWPDIEEGAKQLYHALDHFEEIFSQARNTSLESLQRARLCKTEFKNFIQEEITARNLELSEKIWQGIEFDIELNSSGIAIAAERSLKKEMS